MFRQERKIAPRSADLVGVAGFESTAPRSQSLGKSCGVVRTRGMSCADVVAKIVFDGLSFGSLLHDCYMGQEGP